MQKAIRRADAKLAGYWALELWESGFGKHCWKRLLTVSAEDCWGILTAEVKALHDAYLVVNEGLPAKQHRGRIFISKATDRHFLFQPLGSLPAEGPGSVGFKPGLLVQRRGEFGGVDETVGIRIAGFEVLVAVMLRLHIERQVFGEVQFSVVVFVGRLEDAGDQRSVVCGQQGGSGEEEDGSNDGSEWAAAHSAPRSTLR